MRQGRKVVQVREPRRLLLCFLLAVGVAAATLMPGAGAQSADVLDIYFVDVEGGQAVLFVTSAGESLLMDSGGNFDAQGEVTSRDADRVLEVAMLAGLRRLDYLLTTHYHMDHASAVPKIAATLPIRTFIDHGELRAPELEGERTVRMYQDYAATRASGRHVEMRAGDRTSLAGGVEITAISSNAQPITKPLDLPGAGKGNPLCGEFVRRPPDNTMAASLTAENAASLATVVSFGRFSLISPGDMVWNQEFDLVCPTNLIGEVSMYITPVHGISLAGSRTLVRALRPRVAVWNNGPLKGSREPIDVLRASPGFEDLWQLHYLLPRQPMQMFGEVIAPGGPDNNAPDDFIANLTGKEGGVPSGATLGTPLHEGRSAAFLKVSARRDGSFSVTNSRTGFTKHYAAARRDATEVDG